jgi:predicted TIM-barrel fold metal-dependent hydrolase
MIKSMLAYTRTLDVQPVGFREAETLYRKRQAGSKHLHYFLWAALAEFAGRHGLPFVIHTGIIGRGRPPQDCNPALLHGLVDDPRCEKTTFVLIHTGYPYSRELVLMAFSRPNIQIDFVWLPMLGFETAEQALGEFLEMIPLHRFTIGTDCKEPEPTYGTMVQCRQE